jgi:hypothetical protein
MIFFVLFVVSVLTLTYFRHPSLSCLSRPLSATRALSVPSTCADDRNDDAANRDASARCSPRDFMLPRSKSSIVDVNMIATLVTRTALAFTNAAGVTASAIARASTIRDPSAFVSRALLVSTARLLNINATPVGQIPIRFTLSSPSQNPDPRSESDRPASGLKSDRPVRAEIGVRPPSPRPGSESDRPASGSGAGKAFRADCHCRFAAAARRLGAMQAFRNRL